MTRFNISTAPSVSAPGAPVFSDLVHLIELQELTAHSKQGSRQVRELRATIRPELLRSFDRVTAHGRPAVAAMSETGACGGCHLNLPSGLAAKARLQPEYAIQCPNCGCFLYSPPAQLPKAAPKKKRPARSERLDG